MNTLLIGIYIFATSIHNYPNMNTQQNIIGLRVNNINIVLFDNSLGNPSKASFWSPHSEYIGAYIGIIDGYTEHPEFVVIPFGRYEINHLEFNLSCLPELNAKMHFACAGTLILLF